MQNSKKQLISDIEKLLNSYDGVKLTNINPTLFEFMDEQTLKDIIGSLLDQKESQFYQPDLEWLEKFKKYD